jgi:hypothetical protein
MTVLGLATSGCGSGALARDAGDARDGAPSTDAADAASDTGLEEADAGDARSPMLPDGACFTNAFRQGPTGACACDVASPDICGEACVDLANDDQNCGACGHTCDSPSTCAHGVCGPTPTRDVASRIGCGEMRLASEGASIIYTDTAAGHVMQLAGGSPFQISGAETKAPTLLAVGGTTIFWLDGKTIYRLAGLDISAVYTSVDDVHGLAISDDGATVYFSAGNKVQSVPATGGGTPVDVEIQTLDNPMALAVSGNLLASTVGFVGVVDVIQLGGPMASCSTADESHGIDIACRRVASSQGELNLNSIAATASKVLWADGPNVKMGSLTLDDSSPSPWSTIAYGPGPIVSLAAAGGSVYFNTSDPFAPDSNVVARAPMTADAAASPIRLARKITTNVPGSLAVAGARVYWATTDCGIQSVSWVDTP